MPPTITFDETYQPKLWKCVECGRVLGVIMRTLIVLPHRRRTHTHWLRRLWVFNVDCDQLNVPAESMLRNPPKGFYKLHGLDSVPKPGGVECSICATLNDWNLSKEAYLKLVSRYKIHND